MFVFHRLLQATRPVLNVLGL